MNMPVKILIVEDEMIIAAKISMHLTELGYEISGIVPDGEEAMSHCQQSVPDILLLDIRLRGKMSGIDTALAIQRDIDVPIIYLTASADQKTFDLAKATRPFAFITKPYKKLDLQRAIELVVNRLGDSKINYDEKSEAKDSSYVLNDRIFVKHKEKMVKLFLADIFYIEADRSYCHIFTNNTQYTLSVPLKKLENKLQSGQFFRIHRSYIANLERIDEMTENHVIISRKSIPIGKSYKESFLKRIRMV